jgi:predicted  nucleic acid-binding Zn-ribbon protein
MPNLATLDPAVIRNCITRLEALNPIADELEAFNATRAVKQAELKAVKDEFAALAAERDKCRADYAQARAELVAVLGGLSAAYKQHEELQQQIQKMERSVR